MNRWNDFKHILLYGIILAVLTFALKWLQWRFFILDNAIEIYIGLVALLFTALGVWVATQVLTPKVQTIVIEKKVPESFFLNETELQKLHLNRREYEVLQLLSSGYSNADIAKTLFLSVSTIKSHVSNLFSKMDVKSRTQAIDKAKRLGIIK